MSAGSRAPLQLAILISGRGSNMAAIARACLDGQINARVNVVISDRPGVVGLETRPYHGNRRPDSAVEKHHEPLVDRCECQGRVRGLTGKALDAHRPDLVVLAGFMRILSPQFAAKYAGRMLNIHPSLLPKYRGLHTHRRALEAHDTEHGASVHFVTAELDGGRSFSSREFRCARADTESALAARVQATEHVIYPRVVSLLAEGRLAWDQGRVCLDGKPLDAPMMEDFSGVEKLSADAGK